MLWNVKQITAQIDSVLLDMKYILHTCNVSIFKVCVCSNIRENQTPTPSTPASYNNTTVPTPSCSIGTSWEVEILRNGKEHRRTNIWVCSTNCVHIWPKKEMVNSDVVIYQNEEPDIKKEDRNKKLFWPKREFEITYVSLFGMMLEPAQIHQGQNRSGFWPKRRGRRGGDAAAAERSHGHWWRGKDRGGGMRFYIQNFQHLRIYQTQVRS